MLSKIIKHIAALCCLLQSFTMYALPDGNTLKGMVTDQKGEPIAGVIITIPDLKAGTTTDGDGKYLLNQLPAGRYLVQVRSLGYAAVTRYVDISSVTEENFKLSESILENTEVVITGTSTATEERRSATPIQTLHMKEMREDVFTNVVDAIAKVPGVSQVSTGPAISKPVIRGLGSNRVITLNDGIRQEGQQWGDEHGIEIDDYNVSRIEVLKGPASLAYGSDALAGVINIVSDEIIPAGKINGNVVANYQTNNGLAALHADIAGNQNGFSWKAYGTGKWAHDYKNTYDGAVFNSRFNNVNYGATIGIDRKWGYSRLSYSLFGQNLGLVEGARDSATGSFVKEINKDGAAEGEIITASDGKEYIPQVPSQQITHHKIAWNNSLFIKNGDRIGLILGYQQNTRKEFADVLTPSVPGLEFVLSTFTYDVSYFTTVWKGLHLNSGINGMLQNNANKGIEYLIPDYDLFDVGAYGIAKKDWKKLSVSGGLRYNYRSIDVKSLQIGTFNLFSAFTTHYSNLVGSIGASYLLTKRMALKFNVSSGFRAPNAAELSANGVHEGTIRYEYGNTTLKAETSVQVDACMNWNSEHVMVSASVFYNYISNYIYLQKLIGSNGNDSIPAANNADGFTAFQFTQSNSGLYGGELYIDLHPHPFDWLHLDNTVSFVRGVIFAGSDSTRNLPSMPPLRWQIELRAHTKSVTKWLKNGYAKAGVNTSFAQNNIFSAYGTETATPGYAVLNAGLGVDFTNNKRMAICSVNLSLNNITNISYQDHLNRLKYADINNVTGRGGVYNTGRNLSLMVTIPFGPH